MKRSTVSLVFNIFLGIGLLLLIISLVICYSIKKFDAAAAKTSGTVVDMLERSRSSNSSSPTYTPVVTYEDGNGVKHRYIPSFSSNPPGYHIGESVLVYYDPKNPGDAKIVGWQEYLGAIITGGLGLVFGLIGTGYYTVRKLKHTRNEQLKQSGQLVPAQFVAVDINNYVHVNNRRPFFIRCAWKDPLTGETHAFKSGFIWSDPTPLIDRNKKIDVYMDRNNPRKYYVDIAPFEV